MKRKLLLLWTFLLCFTAGSFAEELSKTITFKEGTGTTSDGSAKVTEIADIISDGADYVSAIPDATNIYNARVGRGIKFGTSSKVGSLTLTLVEKVKPTKIAFTAMWYKSGEESLTVNGKDFTLTDEFVEYTINYDGNTEIESLSFSTPAKRAYVKDVTIYYEGTAPAVSKPTITGTTPFMGSTEVSIACETTAAAIYYTLDGTDPTAGSTQYTAPFTLTESATVKAIAVLGEDKSAIATMEFEAIPSYADLASVVALENGTEFGFTGNVVVVACPTNYYCYIKDNTGHSLIHSYGEIIEVGKTLAPNWTGKIAVFNNLVEIKPTSTLSVLSADAETVTYPDS